MDPVKVFEVDRRIEIAIARGLLEPSSRYREGGAVTFTQKGWSIVKYKNPSNAEEMYENLAQILNWKGDA